MGPGPTLTVVIVNWNTREYLLRGLAVLAGSGSSPRHPMIVVDNASTDGSVEAVRAFAPAVTLIANTTNVGYAAAANQGIAKADTPYLLVANADLTCSPETADYLADFLGRHPHAAVVGPRLEYPGSRLQLSWGPEPHLWSEFVQRGWWRRLERRPGQSWLQRAAARPRRVDWVLGACLGLRRAAWETIGGFDPDYFMYFEEVDLCTRLRRGGWEIWYDPTARATHDAGASVAHATEAMAAAYRRSQLRDYQRFHGPVAAACLRGYLWMKRGWSACP